jgi:hypothetical protein
MQKKHRAESEPTGDASHTAPSPSLTTSMGEQVGDPWPGHHRTG